MTRRAIIVTLVWLLPLAAVTAFVAWRLRPESKTLTWAYVNALIARKFPQVRQISGDELRRWLANPHHAQPLLLDVRTIAEYAVSHLEHARLVHASEPVAKALAGVSHQTLIVTYCSVGYRSSEYAQRLMQDGYSNVYDLKESIFGWANRGWPVYRHGQVVHHVHPYDAYWGSLLQRRLWAFKPAH